MQGVHTTVGYVLCWAPAHCLLRVVAVGWVVVVVCLVLFAMSVLVASFVWHRRAKARVRRHRNKLFEVNGQRADDVHIVHAQDAALINRHACLLPQDLDRVQKVADGGGTLMAGSLGVTVAGGAGGGLAAYGVELEGCLFPSSSLLLLETLGSGCFGTVCKGVLTFPDGKMEDVAVKRLRGRSFQPSRHRPKITHYWC